MNDNESPLISKPLTAAEIAVVALAWGLVVFFAYRAVFIVGHAIHTLLAHI